MKFYIVTYRDKELNCFLKPNISDLNGQDVATTMSRGLMKAEEKDLPNYVGKELLELGYFDDETGVITLHKRPVICLDLDDVLFARAKAVVIRKSQEEKKQEALNKVKEKADAYYAKEFEKEIVKPGMKEIMENVQESQ